MEGRGAKVKHAWLHNETSWTK